MVASCRQATMDSERAAAASSDSNLAVTRLRDNATNNFHGESSYCTHACSLHRLQQYKVCHTHVSLSSALTCMMMQLVKLLPPCKRACCIFWRTLFSC